MTSLYRNESSNSKLDAQRNLEGRTHYVDDGTLRFHKARIVYTDVLANGLGFLLVESYAVDPDNRKRSFRGVVFDVFGTVVYRPDLEDGYKTSQKALDAAMDEVKALNFKALTLAAIRHGSKAHKAEISHLRGIVERMAA